jgi:ABC transporter
MRCGIVLLLLQHGREVIGEGEQLLVLRACGGELVQTTDLDLQFGERTAARFGGLAMLSQAVADDQEPFEKAPLRDMWPVGPWVCEGLLEILRGAEQRRMLVAFAGARARAAAVDETIAAVEAQAYAHRPLGELSGGELQRLLLAQALIGTPQLVLLDEPLASLDMRNQIAVSQLIARLSRERGFSTVLVTHDVNPLLSILDRVLYVAAGRVLCGIPEEVITTEALSRLYGTAIEVLRDSRGRLFVVGLDEEVAHPHGATTRTAMHMRK